MSGEAFQEQWLDSQSYTKYDYGNLVLKHPHQTLQLFIGFIEFYYFHTIKSPIRSSAL